MSEKARLMKAVMTYSFVLVEANLYLDTHPNDKQAIAYFNKYKKLYREAVDEYEKKCGPITTGGVDCDTTWTWSTTPWPWERS